MAGKTKKRKKGHGLEWAMPLIPVAYKCRISVESNYDDLDVIFTSLSRK
jgi:hypothetical protein